MTRPLPLVVPAAGCDCRICPLYRANPRAVEPICSGCNTDCAYCGCARSGGGARCGQCPIRCGSRVDIAAWMADVGGTLAFDDLDELRRVELPPGLPALIPQVHGPAGALDLELGWPAYAIGLRRIFSPRTAALYPSFSGRPAREDLGLGSGQLAVLVGYGDDPLIEAFWTRRRWLIPAIARQGWDLVLAPNFSMYGNQPRAEQLQNRRFQGAGRVKHLRGPGRSVVHRCASRRPAPRRRGESNPFRRREDSSAALGRPHVDGASLHDFEARGLMFALSR